ncbi:hypothetical protein CJF32_00000537 [Rutstroemia sp. NJR-2017a WRK4]|nr:hypothetical protein CJF32_00000537 [Rutstroemia sp. NJR-2017a WRK4]
MQEIGDEMQEATGALSQNNRTSEDFNILDLCMAPGGYTASALKYNSTAKSVGITLPPDQGGHQVLLDSSRSSVFYHDITMFAREFGVDEVPLTHPEYASFSAERPFINQKFDLVFCDGQPAKKHAIRSTFYLIAKNVEPNSEAARLAIKAWKEVWWSATFGGVEGVGIWKIDVKNDYTQSVIDNFGDRLARFARPVWKIQADALSKTPHTNC